MSGANVKMNIPKHIEEAFDNLNVSTSLNRPTMVPATLCVRMFRWQRKVSSTAFRQLRRGRAGVMYALGGWTLVRVQVRQN